MAKRRALEGAGTLRGANGNRSGNGACRAHKAGVISEDTARFLMAHGRALDALNFLLADVRGGLGAYVGVFLVTRAGWDQATLGAVLTASGLIGIVAHVPIGALIDRSRAK